MILCTDETIPVTYEKIPNTDETIRDTDETIPDSDKIIPYIYEMNLILANTLLITLYHIL